MQITTVPSQPISGISNPSTDLHTRAPRIASIDLLRGIVMIVMALDHVRDYFHADAQMFDPLDLANTYPALYFTRWITHFCAPTFMFLAGTSAFLIQQRKGKKATSLFLFTRGLWLILLEVTVINFGWTFNIHFPMTALITIWALGVAMIALSIVIHLPYKTVLAIGLVILIGHNALDGFHVAGAGADAFAWAILHEPRFFTYYQHGFFTGYPVLPWIGIIILGYTFGKLYSAHFPLQSRRRWLLILGVSAVLIFFILRSTNLYGDANVWSMQRSTSVTIMSFFNVVKYPPSLLYALITLGPAIVFLYFAENIRGKFANAVIHIGRVPMFYYILHIYLIHLLALVAVQLTGFGWHAMIGEGFPQVKGYGFSLGIVYLVWIVIILLLYPLCKWYDKYKTAHKEQWWLSYL